MSTSRVELMYDEIVTEFEAITTEGGYRTDPVIKKIIRDIDKITVFPEIGIVMGIEDVTTDDQGKTFEQWVPIYVVGAVKADTDVDDNGTNLYEASEKLLHDIRRIVAGMWTKYINQTTADTAKRWNIGNRANSKSFRVFRILGIGENENKGIVGCEFTVHLRYLDASFND